MEDSTVENRVRMLEELSRGQAKQMDFLVASDGRRTELAQEHAIVMARMADSLASVGEKMNTNRELIMGDMDSKFQVIQMRADRHEERMSKSEEQAVLRFDSIDKRLESHDTDLLDHKRYWKNALWVLGGLFLIGTGLLSAIIQHLVVHTISK